MSSSMLYATRNVTFRAYGIQIDLLERAAQAAGKTTSDYIRDLVVPQAAKDLNVELPPLPQIERGRYGSMIAKAAKVLGMTREELEQLGAQELAARVLAEKAAETETAARPAKRAPSKARGFGVYAGEPADAGGGTSARSPKRRTGG